MHRYRKSVENYCSPFFPNLILEVCLQSFYSIFPLLVGLYEKLLLFFHKWVWLTLFAPPLSTLPILTEDHDVTVLTCSSSASLTVTLAQDGCWHWAWDPPPDCSAAPPSPSDSRSRNFRHLRRVLSLVPSSHLSIRSTYFLDISSIVLINFLC